MRIPNRTSIFEDMELLLNLPVPDTPNTSKKVLHGVCAQMAVPKISLTSLGQANKFLLKNPMVQYFTLGHL